MPGPHDDLEQLESAGLLRSLKPIDSPAGPRVVRDGREMWNFASNDYLGLARHPRVEAALVEGVKTYGAGSAASRLVCGTLPPHRLLEEHLATAKQTEAALVFPSGFVTSLGVIPAVCGKGDFVLLDKLSHACLIDAARLSGATLRVFPHNDMGKLAALLENIRAKHAHARILVATESVFSMDGDLCPLREIVELVESHGALLLLDEAHGFGVLGEHGMGLAEQENLQRRVTFQMGTLSKAAGLSGGYVAASRAWIDLLVNRARSFIYTTAPPPALAHAAI
ncbi:MAG TPA: 8-amino-7-oxononanoate synthase, partial [Luteolibacter sp.]|nr:8-amino-7-oxononanoate synthase [Luteolibacter sp.]